jgi:hypothetical protein
VRLPRLTSRRPVPPQVKALVLDAGERRVSWATTESGEPVVATDRGLRLPGRDPLPWTDVEKAAWEPPVLTVSQVAEVEGAGPATSVRLADEGDLPQVVRARVTASVVWSSHARLRPAGGVRIVGRRAPGLEVLDWQIVFDRGTDPADPAVRAQADQLLELARRSVG